MLARLRKLNMAHSRTRGDDVGAAAGAGGAMGSSPLTRGPWLSEPSHWRGKGLIPAHAGTMALLQIPRFAVAAHSRTRGDHCLIQCPRQTSAGSFPHTRGN